MNKEVVPSNAHNGLVVKIPRKQATKIKNGNRGKNYGTQPAKSTGGQKRASTVCSSMEESWSEFRMFTRTWEILSPLEKYI